MRHRGITLVEVLATITIVAIVLPVAMKGISMATTVAGIARQRTEATSLAQRQLNELLITGDWQSGILQGDFGADWPDYRWEAAVEDWDEQDIEHLHVAVSWTTRGVHREVTLSTLVYSNSTSTGSTP